MGWLGGGGVYDMTVLLYLSVVKLKAVCFHTTGCEIYTVPQYASKLKTTKAVLIAFFTNARQAYTAASFLSTTMITGLHNTLPHYIMTAMS